MGVEQVWSERGLRRGEYEKSEKIKSVFESAHDYSLHRFGAVYDIDVVSVTLGRVDFFKIQRRISQQQIGLSARLGVFELCDGHAKLYR